MGIFKRKDSPNWWYRIQFDRKVVTATTHTKDKRLAYRIYLEKHRRLVEEHHLPAARHANTSFFKMCSLYIENHSKVNKMSWKDDELLIKKLKAFFGDAPLSTLRPEDIERYKGSRRGLVMEATINRELTIIKGIFSKALAWGYSGWNPAKDVRMFKEEQAPIKILSPEERIRLFDASPDFMRPILVAALKTGMRQGEILNLRWKDVDFEHDFISVCHTKTRKLRQVPMHPELRENLMALSKISELVFCNPAGRRMSPTGRFRTAFVALKRQAGLPGLTFHALRHNFATELVARGADLRTVQEYMGHSSLTMLQRYAHVSRGIWRSTIQLLARDIPSAPSNRGARRAETGENASPQSTTLALRSDSVAVSECGSERK